MREYELTAIDTTVKPEEQEVKIVPAENVEIVALGLARSTGHCVLAAEVDGEGEFYIYKDGRIHWTHPERPHSSMVE